MPRIELNGLSQATGTVKSRLDAVRVHLAMVPNFVRALADSPAALAGYLNLSAALDEATLDLRTRERIALALAERNACRDCLSVHETFGLRAGLDADELTAARGRGSIDDGADAAVRFAVRLDDARGAVTDAELDAVGRAGLGDAGIVEVIAVVALSLFTNLLGKTGRIAVDLPRAPALDAAA